jgi:hypothetical protein
VTLPKQVKVGGLTYNINLVDEPMESGEEPAAVFFHKQEIRIKNGLTKGVQELCLMHELMHLVFYHIGYYPENDEEVIDRLSKTLYQVMVDNSLTWGNNK